MAIETRRRLFLTFGLCLVFVILEALFAGGDISAKIDSVKMPAYSPPLWGWFVIGALYYVVCFTVIYRLLKLDIQSGLRTAGMVLIILVMFINAAWNILFFQTTDFQIIYLAFLPYNLIALALLIILTRLDRIAALSFAPYMIYLLYANIWAYGVWRLNAVISG